MRRTAVLVLSVLALSGCGEPKLDGSSDEALKKSVAKVAESLPDEKRGQFSEDLKVIAMSQINLAGVLKGESNVETTQQTMRITLDGKTAGAVAAEAQKIRLEREARQREQALLEIKELLDKKAIAETAKQQLAKFSVSKSRFYLREEKYSSRPKPVIEISVLNSTDQAISRAYFKGTIASPGRSVPWFSDEFNYEISGGLEPGEKASWTLLPNMFSEWGKVNAPDDAIFTVEVYRLDGADKEALYDASGLSERELKRLSDLQAKYAGS